MPRKTEKKEYENSDAVDGQSSSNWYNNSAGPALTLRHAVGSGHHTFEAAILRGINDCSPNLVVNHGPLFVPGAGHQRDRLEQLCGTDELVLADCRPPGRFKVVNREGVELLDERFDALVSSLAAARRVKSSAELTGPSDVFVVDLTGLLLPVNVP
jgi:hypothetical protein